MASNAEAPLATKAAPAPRVVSRSPAPRARIAPPRGLTALVLVLAVTIVAGLPVEAAASVITHGPSARPRVALTFDDGWSRSRCQQIARILRANRVVGTFFLNGVYVRQDPATWRHILGSFPYGNHTYEHPDLRRLGAGAIRDQIASNERIEEGIFHRPMLKLMRPPYGSWNETVRRVAGQLGYRSLVLWSQDTLDWSSSATVSSVFRRATAGGRGSIVLMHCGPGVTPLALPAIIRSYKVRGYRLVGLDTLLGMRSGGGHPGPTPRPTPKPTPRPTPKPKPKPTPAPTPRAGPSVPPGP